MDRAFHEALLLRERSRVLDKKTRVTTSARGRLRNLLVDHDRRFNYALIQPDEQKARERERKRVWETVWKFMGVITRSLEER